MEDFKMYKKADEFYSDGFKIEILCSKQAVEELLPLLNCLLQQGSIGHSANIVVDPESDREQDFFFDGDGSSKIQEIRVNELMWDEKWTFETSRGRMIKDGVWWKETEYKGLRKKVEKGTCQEECQCEKLPQEE